MQARFWLTISYIIDRNQQSCFISFYICYKNSVILWSFVVFCLIRNTNVSIST